MAVAARRYALTEGALTKTRGDCETDRLPLAECGLLCEVICGCVGLHHAPNGCRWRLPAVPSSGNHRQLISSVSIGSAPLGLASAICWSAASDPLYSDLDAGTPSRHPKSRAARRRLFDTTPFAPHIVCPDAVCSWPPAARADGFQP